MPNPTIVGDQVWCPRCKQYVQLLKIKRAAKVADVSCKTIYRYVEEGKVYSHQDCRFDDPNMQHLSAETRRRSF